MGEDRDLKQTERQKENPPGRELALRSAQDGSQLVKAWEGKPSAGGEETRGLSLPDSTLHPYKQPCVLLSPRSNRSGPPLCVDLRGQ